jgi:hypothetical protein
MNASLLPPALLFLALLTAGLAPRASAQAVDLPLVVTDGADGARTLRFGLDPTATDGIDPALGESELPPFPPTGVFEARFVGTDIGVPELGLGSYRDYRAGSTGFEGTVVHEIQYQVGDGTEITIAWDLPATVTGRLQDLITGAIIDEPMSGAGAFTVTNPGALNKLKLTLAYTPSNAPPNAADDTASTLEDEAVVIDVLANDSDPDGDALSIVAVSAPAHGTAEAVAGGVLYTPTPDYNGTDSFSYTISDGNGGEDSATVTVTVIPVNDPPTAAVITDPPDGSSLIVEGAGSTEVAVAWTASTDIEGDPVSYRWEATLTEGDFSAPVLSTETDETTVSTTFGALDAALAEAGVAVGASAVVYHRVVASDGEAETAGPAASVTVMRGVIVSSESGAAVAFASRGAYPNPSAGDVRIALDLPWHAEVSVEVFDVTGRRVALIVEGVGAGTGRTVPVTGLRSGVYLYRLVARGPAETQAASGQVVVTR